MSTSALINAMSGFWFRYFRDLPDIDSLFQATELRAGDEYLRLLGTVLGLSVTDAPLRGKELCRVWELRDEDVIRVDGRWAVKKPENWSNLRYLSDHIITPTVLLDEISQYVVEKDYVIFFAEDPRTTFKTAATRIEKVEVGALLKTNVDPFVGAGALIEVEGIDGQWRVLYERQGEIGLHPEARLDVSLTNTRWRRVGEDTWYHADLVGKSGEAATDLNDPPTGEVYVRGIWALECEIDQLTLYNNWGHLLEGPDGPPVPSSEHYRNLLLGVLRLCSHGPTVRRVEEGLTAVAGLPLVRRDREVVTEIKTTDAVRTVYTDQSVYEIPVNIPLRADVVVGATLNAFQTLTDAIQVVDTTIEPYWWLGITVPQTFMPTSDERSRRVTASLYPNKSGIPYRNTVANLYAKVGEPWVRSNAYYLTNLILKHNMFGVRIAPAVDHPPGTIDRIENLIQDIRPPHKYAYVWTPLRMSAEVVTVADALTITQSTSS